MWSHKYEPELLVQNHTDNINKLIGTQNLLVYGPHGSGVFDAVNNALTKHKLIHNHEWNYTDCRLSNDNKNTLRLLVRQNKQCFEFVMKDYGTNERYVVKNILQELSNKYVIESNQLDLVYKVIVVYNVEWFSKESQQVLGIFAEKFSNCSRYVFSTHQTTNVSPKLKSQCVLYRVPRPSVECLKEHMYYILASENKELDDAKMENIFETYSNHIEDCVNNAQLSVYNVQNSLDKVYDKIIDILLSEKIHKIKYIRELVYILLVNNINCTKFFASIVDKLTLISPDMLHDAIRLAAVYEPRLHRCERSMYHIEAFFMQLIRVISNNTTS